MNHMAIDQYGETIHDLGPYPRKGLLAKLGHKHVDKMYVSRKDGSIAHSSYIVSGRWFRVFKVEPWEKPA